MFDTKKLFIRLSMVLALAFTVACGDEDPVVETDAGTDVAATDVSGSGDASMEDTSMEDTSEASTDLCTNEADLAIVTSEDVDPDEEGNQTVTSIAQDCGISCIGDADSRQCSIDCIVAATGVSELCSGCYGDVVACSIQNCLGSCGTDPGGEACGTCQAENCLDDFYVCTGLPNDDA